MVRGRRGVWGGGTPALPVPVLRDAVERELAGVSLRQAAREIGISPNGLRNFVAGASPRLTTRRRFERWLASRPNPSGGPSVGRFLELVEGLSPDLAPRDARAIARHLTEDLVDAYHRTDRPLPRWVRELASHYDTGAPE